MIRIGVKRKSTVSVQFHLFYLIIFLLTLDDGDQIMPNKNIY